MSTTSRAAGQFQPEKQGLTRPEQMTRMVEMSAITLDGQVAIVTGGAVRIGRVLSLSLAEAGADVCVHYGHSSAEADQLVEEIAAKGRRALAVEADLRRPEEAARRVIDATYNKFGRADVLVNNAAIFEPGTLLETDRDHWDRHLAINLEGPFFLSQAFVAVKADGKEVDEAPLGHIVNIVDWRATRPPSGHLVYTLTKSALAALTRILAQELAPRVRVNAIAPGVILPPPGGDEADLEQFAGQNWLKRPGTPEEVARTLLFLLGSDFITGEVVHVSAGQEL